MKIHLVDGTFELFRCFHGAPRATDDDGREIGAVRGILYTFTSLLRQPDVTHLAVAFDQMAGRTRKDGRDSDNSLIGSQYMPAADALRALGITLWPMYRFQADDALATGARLYKDAPGVEQVVICSTDKDLAQCVEGERVVTLDRIRKRTADEQVVIEKFGVSPALIPDLLGLVGDPADGLPGVPGWGPKTAAALLRHYHRIEKIPESAADWEVTVRSAQRLAENLHARRREAIMVRNLATLRTDLPITDSIDDLEWRGADRDALTAMAKRLEVEEVLTRMPRWRSPG
jgi:5'-3' exonuclease